MKSFGTTSPNGIDVTVVVDEDCKLVGVTCEGDDLELSQEDRAYYLDEIRSYLEL